jgi:transposase-like protein
MDTKTTTTEIVDDGSRRDRLGRTRRPKASRDRLLADYERSGLSQAAFARRAGVRYTTFAHWVQDRRRKTGRSSPVTSPAGPSAAAPQFVELRLPTAALPAVAPVPLSPGLSSPGAELSVSLPDGLILRGTEPLALAALVRALRANPA